MSIGGESYKVSFIVRGVAVQHDIMLQDITISMNNSAENNYIRVDNETDRGLTSTSFTDKAGGNTGYWSSAQNKENKGTTDSHEYGHGLGLDHPATDKKENKQPDIMMTEFNYNQVQPKYVTHTADGTKLDVSQRKVMQRNIRQVFTPQVIQNLQQNGTSDVGSPTNVYHPYIPAAHQDY